MHRSPSGPGAPGDRTARKLLESSAGPWHEGGVTIVGWFWVSFGATLALAALAIWSGFGGGRRVHLVAGPATMVLLTVTILLTERFARARAFPEAEMGIHLWFAKTAALLALPVIATGILTARRPTWRKRHRIAVLLFLLAVVIATATGIWVFSLSTPR